MSGFAIRDAEREDQETIRSIVFSVLREYGLTPDPEETDSDLEDIDAHYIRRGGMFRVVEDESGAIVGCGGLYPLSETEGEIRKMYLLPRARGRGMGRALLEDLTDGARRRRYQRIVLETAAVLREAIALYRKVGFVEITREQMACRCDQAFALELAGAREA
jgi:putative acetyltransferase